MNVSVERGSTGALGAAVVVAVEVNPGSEKGGGI
jgi:hypothetical protein